MGGKFGHPYKGATHITKVFVKMTIQCSYEVTMVKTWLSLKFFFWGGGGGRGGVCNQWTGLDWTGLTFCTNCTEHASIQVVYCVCCYFEEALQPPIPKPQKSCNNCKAGKGGGGGGGGGGAGLSALFAN